MNNNAFDMRCNYIARAKFTFLICFIGKRPREISNRRLSLYISITANMCLGRAKQRCAAENNAVFFCRNKFTVIGFVVRKLASWRIVYSSGDFSVIVWKGYFTLGCLWNGCRDGVLYYKVGIVVIAVGLLLKRI